MSAIVLEFSRSSETKMKNFPEDDLMGHVVEMMIMMMHREKSIIQTMNKSGNKQLKLDNIVYEQRT